MVPVQVPESCGQTEEWEKVFALKCNQCLTLQYSNYCILRNYVRSKIKYGGGAHYSWEKFNIVLRDEQSDYYYTPLFKLVKLHRLSLISSWL